MDIEQQSQYPLSEEDQKRFPHLKLRVSFIRPFAQCDKRDDYFDDACPAIISARIVIASYPPSTDHLDAPSIYPINDTVSCQACPLDK
ncbi:hypothetical protein KKD37_04570 [Patescibacteria group bacterium]|nr:hypothetical protein [Patescibacteria group bacterium]